MNGYTSLLKAVLFRVFSVFILLLPPLSKLFRRGENNREILPPVKDKGKSIVSMYFPLLFFAIVFPLDSKRFSDTLISPKEQSGRKQRISLLRVRIKVVLYPKLLTYSLFCRQKSVNFCFEMLYSQRKKEARFMKELSMEYNPLNLKVLINGEPSIDLIPKDTLDMIITELDKQIQADTLSFVNNRDSPK